MANVTFDVYHDVLVVPILDLQDVAYEGVSTKRIREILNGLLMLFLSFLAKLLVEVVNKGGESVFCTQLFFN